MCLHAPSVMLLRIISSLAKGGYVFGPICLSVCKQHYSKSYKCIPMKFYGGVWGGKMNK